jgi:hypothetical protein
MKQLFFLFCWSFVIPLFFFLITPPEVNAEMYHWTDRQGIVHITNEKPEGVNAEKVYEKEINVKQGTKMSWEERFQRICKPRRLSGFSENLLISYREELKQVEIALDSEYMSQDERREAERDIEHCYRRIQGALEEARRREKRSAREDRGSKQNEEAFIRLQKLVQEKLEERRNSRLAYAKEGLRFYDDLKYMATPLRYGMTMEEVKAVWKEPLRIRSSGSSSGDVEWWYYPMSIRLHFKDGMLTYWSARK